MRLFVPLAVIAAALLLPTLSAGGSPYTAWEPCSLAKGDAAAREAGLAQALNRDRAFGAGGTRTSELYRHPTTSLCGDFNHDGRMDRAVHYQCCTVSSPAPWVVLRRIRGRWRIVYERLHDTTWKLEGDGRALVTTEPKYDLKRDALCCPSHLRIGTLRWTGHVFKRTFVITGPDG